ncbi:hypothetical protein ACH4TP_37840 [Streptomyces sp. NPDC021012]|uniref:hypothetical protein n=1 Tax=Streptomyces sp. NPDC021012 TaxID=3365107 RepID=UPI0037A0B27E
MPTSSLVQQTVSVELAVADAPAFKYDYSHYDVTGLRITYQDGNLADLTLIGTEQEATGPDADKTTEISGRLEFFDRFPLWVRVEVERHRPGPTT